MNVEELFILWLGVGMIGGVLLGRIISSFLLRHPNKLPRKVKALLIPTKDHYVFEPELYISELHYAKLEFKEAWQDAGPRARNARITPSYDIPCSEDEALTLAAMFTRDVLQDRFATYYDGDILKLFCGGYGNNADSAINLAEKLYAKFMSNEISAATTEDLFAIE